MLWHGLDNAVLHPYGMLGNTVVVDPGAAVSLVEEKGASWETNISFLFKE